MISLILPFLFLPTAKADQVQYLAGPKTSLAAFTTSVAQAKTSIDVATFIFESCDPSTQVLLELLAQKARSGVRVRVLLDAFQQKVETRDALTAFLKDAGAQIRLYNAGEPNMRMHLKMMVIDGQSYVTGGRNLSDRYFALSSLLNYVDRDVLVRGDSARQAQSAFNELWSSNLSSVQTSSVPFAGWKGVCGNTSTRVSEIKNLLSNQGAILLANAPTRNCSRVKFLADHPDFGSSIYSDYGSYDTDSYMTATRLARKRTTSGIIDFLTATRSSLQIENWFYTPMGQMDGIFSALRERDVKIQVMTNDDADDGPDFFKEAMEYAGKIHAERDSVGPQEVQRLSSRGSMSAAHELTPAKAPFYLHSKVIVRDNRDVVVSSFNLDPRSYNTNLESAVIVENCPSLAADVRGPFDQLHAVFARDKASGRVPQKPEASFGAKMFAIFSLGLL